jgi:phosphoglycolate phosphatase
LLSELGLARRAAVVVSGDTLAQRKPDPAPVTFACRALHVEPAQTWFVGDDLRDVQAGNAAGTKTVIAEYGYLAPGDAPESWGADYRIARASDLAGLLRLG